MGLAGAETSPFRVWLENWYAESLEPGAQKAVPRMALSAAEDGVALNLALISLKPPVLQGDNGLSQKGREPGNASYYYSLSRLQASGTIRINHENHSVQGASWMDREWSTSALENDQVGWDWFALQFSDNRELMYYQLRRNDGTVDPLSKGVLIDADAASRRLTAGHLRINIEEHWQSPKGSRYPARWQIISRPHNLNITLAPLMLNQELQGAFRYWEGAVAFSGDYDGKPVTGRGYVEMTGY
jgi:predicted secreted hydrolase